ncbi:EcsC family protein [Desulfobacterales bacterium HSG16]|nr:EcsC family protein [Desulfobacterales bacterium HSG16]
MDLSGDELSDNGLSGNELSGNDLKDIEFARMMLENTGFMMKLANYCGSPLEKSLTYLPETWNEKIQNISETALTRALETAIMTMNKKSGIATSERVHKMLAALTGCAGGMFGLPALGIELPVATTIMLRSVADIARSEGENITSVDSKLACIEVFALGGGMQQDSKADTGYFAVRAALSKAVNEAASFIAENGIVEAGAPVLVRLISMIAARFGIVVSEKIAASAVPVIGALGGGVVNTIFINHYQDMAKGHFIVRRLERRYGKEKIKIAYESLP